MGKKKLAFLVAGFIFLASFYFLSVIVKSKVLGSFDFDTTVRIQNHIPKRFDTILSFLSLLGSFEILFVVLCLILIVHKKIIAIFTTLFFFLAAHVGEIFGKAFLRHPGPPFLFFRYDIPFLFPSSYVQPGSSYPSGHSLRITFIAVVVTYLLMISKKLKKNPAGKIIAISLVWGFAVIMLITRVSLGEHWATDVIGGALFGTGMGFLSLIFF